MTTEGVKRDALLALEKRVAEAKGPDRVLDFEIHIAVVQDEIWPARDWYGRITDPNVRMSDYLRLYRDVINADDQDFDIPRYTSSIDAALTLVSRVLPGVSWQVRWQAPPAYHSAPCAHSVLMLGPDEGDHFAKAATPALAILLALLRSLTKGAGG